MYSSATLSGHRELKLVDVKRRQVHVVDQVVEAA